MLELNPHAFPFVILGVFALGMACGFWIARVTKDDGHGE